MLSRTRVDKNCTQILSLSETKALFFHPLFPTTTFFKVPLLISISFIKQKVNTCKLYKNRPLNKQDPGGIMFRAGSVAGPRGPRLSWEYPRARFDGRPVGRAEAGGLRSAGRTHLRFFSACLIWWPGSASRFAARCSCPA